MQADLPAHHLGLELESEFSVEPLQDALLDVSVEALGVYETPIQVKDAVCHLLGHLFFLQQGGTGGRRHAASASGGSCGSVRRQAASGNGSRWQVEAGGSKID